MNRDKLIEILILNFLIDYPKEWCVEEIHVGMLESDSRIKLKGGFDDTIECIHLIYDIVDSIQSTTYKARI